MDFMTKRSAHAARLRTATLATQIPMSHPSL